MVKLGLRPNVVQLLNPRIDDGYRQAVAFVQGHVLDFVSVQAELAEVLGAASVLGAGLVSDQDEATAVQAARLGYGVAGAAETAPGPGIWLGGAAVVVTVGLVVLVVVVRLVVAVLRWARLLGGS